MKGNARIRFGIFDFDCSTGELFREGAPVRLPAQPAQVLRVLIEADGELVTRERLRESVWGSNVNVDFDRGLNFCISQIRTALKDSTDSPRFILTVPKRGYRFIAPISKRDVSPVQTPVAESDRAALVSEPPAPSRRKWMMSYSSAAFGAAGLAAWAWASYRWNKPGAVAVVRFDNETGDASLEHFADAITDFLVVQLTASTAGNPSVIGNAAELRRPRDKRDLRAIGETLGAQFVILGQLLRTGARFEVLAHLIEMPRQNHLRAARFELLDAAKTAEEISAIFIPILRGDG